jgi:hypothetical protein
LALGFAATFALGFAGVGFLATNEGESASALTSRKMATTQRTDRLGCDGLLRGRLFGGKLLLGNLLLGDLLCGSLREGEDHERRTRLTRRRPAHLLRSRCLLRDGFRCRLGCFGDWLLRGSLLNMNSQRGKKNRGRTTTTFAAGAFLAGALAAGAFLATEALAAGCQRKDSQKGR